MQFMQFNTHAVQAHQHFIYIDHLGENETGFKGLLSATLIPSAEVKIK